MRGKNWYFCWISRKACRVSHMNNRVYCGLLSESILERTVHIVLRSEAQNRDLKLRIEICSPESRSKAQNRFDFHLVFIFIFTFVLVPRRYFNWRHYLPSTLGENVYKQCFVRIFHHLLSKHNTPRHEIERLSHFLLSSLGRYRYRGPR